jgi:uncharacterized protein YbbK (DUF523 family)
MDPQVRPIIVISRCIDFDSCRYNGKVIRASLREHLEPLVDLHPICPELEIGLGVPRDPVTLLRGGEEGIRMVQPSTGRDLTDLMNAFAQRFLDSLDAVDGFILKSRSPSCAVRDHEGGPGLFTARVMERFPGVPIEDEARLADEGVRRSFLDQVFARASSRSR